MKRPIPIFVLYILSIIPSSNNAVTNATYANYGTGVSLSNASIIAEYDQPIATPIQIGSSTTEAPGTYLFTKMIEYSVANSTASATADAAIIIDSDNVTIDLNGHVLVCNSGVTTAAHGILVKDGIKNITIKNGTISGFKGDGINVAGTSNSIVTGLTIENMKFINNRNGIAATYTNDSKIENCKIVNSNDSLSTSNQTGIGAWFINCSGITCNNIDSSGHSGNKAYGFKLDTITGGTFENCTSFKNTGASTSSPTANTPEAAIGFFLKDSTGCNFINCRTADNVSTRYAYGFYLTGCSGNVLEKCSSLRNRATTENILATSSGFYSLSGIGNTWTECISNGNIVNSATTGSTDGYGAFGFFLGNEQQSTLNQCSAKGNGLTTNHLANATGIFLDGTVNTDCKYCLVRGCEANANCTSKTSGISAYGIRDSATDTTNIIINCIAFGNSDNATTRVVTNYSMDLAIGGTTPANWPRIEANMDGLINLSNKPDFYNVSITS